MGKIDKNYQEERRLLVIIFYGSYSSSVFSLGSEKLSRSTADYKENIRFIDIIDFARELNFLTGNEIQDLEEINNLIIAALKGVECALEKFETLQDEALLELEEYKNRYLGNYL